MPAEQITDTREFDSNTSGLRDTIEGSVATHDPGGPDTETLVGYAREDHARTIKKQNDESTPADRSDRLRRSIRNAVSEAKLKAAQPEKPKTNGAEAPIGPPQNWSLDAKAEFQNLPHDVKMAALREQKAFTDAVGPIAEKYKEVEEAIAPFRQHYAPHGLSDKQAIGNALGWARELQGPNKHQAMLGLMQQTGIGLQELVAMAYGQPAPAVHEQSLGHLAQEQMTREAVNEIAQFSKDKPDFAQLKMSMGALMAGGYAQTLEQAYQMAGGGKVMNGPSAASKRRAAVSPRGGSPAGKVERDGGKRGSGVRDSIVSAFREARGLD